MTIAARCTAEYWGTVNSAQKDRREHCNGVFTRGERRGDRSRVTIACKHRVKHRGGSVGSVVANHRGGGEISMVVTTLNNAIYKHFKKKHKGN